VTSHKARRTVPIPLSNDDYVILKRTDYDAMIEVLEKAEDIAEIDRQADEELIPGEIVDRLIAGDNPIRVFREWRGHTAADLAEQVGIAPSYLSQLETGKREGRLETISAIAQALELDLADIADWVTRARGQSAN
jgi:DNA-binding Xre family transcriptional regulator